MNVGVKETELSEEDKNDIKGYIGNVKWNKKENWFECICFSR